MVESKTSKVCGGMVDYDPKQDTWQMVKTACLSFCPIAVGEHHGQGNL